LATPPDTPVTLAAPEPAPQSVVASAQPAPLAVASFLPAAQPAPATATLVRRRRHPKAVGWTIVCLLVAGLAGNVVVHGDSQIEARVTAIACGVLGAGLAVSPWAGRPRWLAPVAGTALAVGAITLLLLMLFNQL
jgi:hypothetical protein